MPRHSTIIAFPSGQAATVELNYCNISLYPQFPYQTYL